jgi:hypothetical protein
MDFSELAKVVCALYNMRKYRSSQVNNVLQYGVVRVTVTRLLCDPLPQTEFLLEKLRSHEVGRHLNRDICDPLPV